MSRSKPIAYTTETGVENPETPTIEVAIPTRVRIQDAQYGLATAAKVTAQRIEREKSRVAELAEVSAQIARINMSLLRGTCSDKPKAIALRDKLAEQRTRLSGAGTHWSTPKTTA